MDAGRPAFTFVESLLQERLVALLNALFEPYLGEFSLHVIVLPLPKVLFIDLRTPSEKSPTREPAFR